MTRDEKLELMKETGECETIEELKTMLLLFISMQPEELSGEEIDELDEVLNDPWGNS